MTMSILFAVEHITLGVSCVSAIALLVLGVLLWWHRQAIGRVYREAEDYRRAAPPPQVTVLPPQVTVQAPTLEVPAAVPVPVPVPCMAHEQVLEVLDSMQATFDAALCSYAPDQKVIATVQAVRRAAAGCGMAAPMGVEALVRERLIPVPVPVEPTNG